VAPGTRPIRFEHAAIDAILEDARGPLDADFTAYRNHAYRVFNFALTLCAAGDQAEEKIAVAAAFHDLAIWTNGTFDYLPGSIELARAYLSAGKKTAWAPEIDAMIDNHHKMRPYRGRHAWIVEPFRRADWIDVSRGRLRFELPAQYVRDVLAEIPNAGFHRRLAALTLHRARVHPFNPLPMVKF
jgi:hypothetical protein